MRKYTPPPITGLLVSDQGNASIAGTSKVLLVRDLDGDGFARSAGEVTVFFDGSNASGLVNPTENVFSIFQAKDRSVYVADGDTDTIYHLIDKNGDGGANDAGEASVWFSPANAGGFSTVTPNGIAQGKDGAIYITNAGTTSVPPDMVYRTVDLNGDGDANDAGEATVWADLQKVISTSVPFDITFIGDVAYVSDLTGAAVDVIHRLQDLNNDGDAMDAGEITSFAVETSAYGAPLDIAIDSQNNSILALTWTASAGQPHKLYRLTDLNGSGKIDDPSESVEVWNSTCLPAGFSQAAGFSVSVSKNGQVALAVNGSGPATKNIYLLTDLDGDGLFKGEEETQVLASNSYLADSLYRPRAVEFYNSDLDTTIKAGSSKNDCLAGTSKNDLLLGYDGNDRLSGSSGNDRLWGGTGNDCLDGGTGDDSLRGNAGNDQLTGGIGNDNLKGGAGCDVLSGSLGKDSFVFSERDGGTSHDVIIDFKRGTDVMILDGLEISSIVNTRQGARVTFDDGSDVLVKCVAANQLTASDFIFQGDATGSFFA
jgi:Ca2+-binding RTX toxin-like protein